MDFYGHSVYVILYLTSSAGRRIGVTSSVDNCRLFVGGIPKDKTDQDIFQELGRVTDNLVKVFARPWKSQSLLGDGNRGFAFAEYASHR